MGKRQPHSESGQVFAELALILGVVALVCVVALSVLGGGVRDRFGESGSALDHGPLTPASMTSPALVFPSKIADCDGGGWRNYAQFKSADDCRKYLEDPEPPAK